MTDSKMPEPVAWRYRCAEKFTAWTDPTFNRRSPYARIGMEEQPLYTHPAPVADAELEALVEALDSGVTECGMHEDNSTELYDVDGANEVMAQAADALRARTAQPVGVQWHQIETAPYDMPVRVKLGKSMIIAAVLRKDASMTTDETPCDQWQAHFEGEHPECWTDGACWESNSSGVMSLQPTAWAALLPEGGA